MIPKYPKFSPLRISQYKEYNRFISKYPPYSDINFISLFCWNLDNSTKISMINGNIVIKMKNYENEDRICIFIGDTDINQSLKQILFKYGVVQFFPRILVKYLDKSIFKIDRDRRSYDYLLSINRLVSYKSKGLKSKRNGNNSARRMYKDINFKNHLDKKEFKQCVEKIMDKWLSKKYLSTPEELESLKNLDSAIKRFFKLDRVDVKCDRLSLAISGEYVCFAICEVHNEKYVIAHFINANTREYKYLYEVFYNEIAKYYHSMKIKYINIEQDLGIDYMRRTKLKWHPIGFLKKYRLTLK